MTPSEKRAKETAEALTLRLGGATYEQIADRQGLTARGVRGRVDKALAKMQRESAEAQHLLDLGRLDRALTSVQIAVKNGDTKAVGSLIKLQDERRSAQARFEAVRRYGETSLRTATEKSLAGMDWLEATDDAAKQAAIVAASTIDDLLAAGDPKAVYAIPHLINSLKALGGTPAERRALQKPGEDDEDELSQLRRRRRERRGA